MATQTAERATTRNTIQRALVLEAVQSLHNHPTSADVYEVVRARHPNISRATVYRNLGVLANRGEVLRVEVPNGADRYDFRNRPHYHAKCRVCGGVFDVDMPYQSDILAKVSARKKAMKIIMPKNGLTTATAIVKIRGMTILSPGKKVNSLIPITCCCVYTVK